MGIKLYLGRRKIDRKRRTKTDLFNSLYRVIALFLAGGFVIIGAGVLLGLILPNSYLLTGSLRFVFGGFILIYGLARIYMIVFRRKKGRKVESQSEDT